MSLISFQFEESIAAKKAALLALEKKIEDSALLIEHSLKQGGTILICGNGGSAADAQHFAAELVNRFETERPPLSGLALTTDTSNITSIGNDYHFNDIFSKQILALGKSNDTLIAISTSGQSPSIINAIHIALEKKMNVIALTGKNGGVISTIDHPNLSELRVPHDRTARIQEVHLLIIHTWCAYLDKVFTISS